jgi:hypothetical protein
MNSLYELGQLIVGLALKPYEFNELVDKQRHQHREVNIPFLQYEEGSNEQYNK